MAGTNPVDQQYSQANFKLGTRTPMLPVLCSFAVAVGDLEGTERIALTTAMRSQAMSAVLVHDFTVMQAGYGTTCTQLQQRTTRRRNGQYTQCSMSIARVLLYRTVGVECIAPW